MARHFDSQRPTQPQQREPHMIVDRGLDGLRQSAQSYVTRSIAHITHSCVHPRIIDWTDRGTCVLFGDGAGAVVLAASDQPGILSTHIHADGRYERLLRSVKSRYA